jgi:hypothetical protein
MAEAKVGDEFITHEFDEAIAIHRQIVEAERALASTHPVTPVKRAIKGYLRDDERFLKELETLGAEKGATGKVEEVAGSMTELMRTTLASAPEAESEAYEAHAVLLSLKRKQQDSGLAMIRIARDRRDRALREAATRFERGQRLSAKQLGDSLADFAVRIASAASAHR